MTIGTRSLRAQLLLGVVAGLILVPAAQGDPAFYQESDLRDLHRT